MIGKGDDELALPPISEKLSLRICHLRMRDERKVVRFPIDPKDRTKKTRTSFRLLVEMALGECPKSALVNVAMVSTKHNNFHNL